MSTNQVLRIAREVEKEMRSEKSFVMRVDRLINDDQETAMMVAQCNGTVTVSCWEYFLVPAIRLMVVNAVHLDGFGNETHRVRVTLLRSREAVACIVGQMRATNKWSNRSPSRIDGREQVVRDKFLGRCMKAKRSL